MAQINGTLTLTRVGEHWMDGGLYQDEKGRYYVDHFSAVESGKVNSVDILCPSDDPSGEPDYTLTGIIILTNPPSEHEKLCKRYEFELMMLGRLKSDCEGFFSEGMDCRKGHPRYLWAGSVPGQVRALRDFYGKLPDDIKDASRMTLEEIEDYCRRLEAWAVDEFAKPEYDPVERTRREDLPEEFYLDEKLYYTDDDGKLQTPTHIWFSSDTRRWHQDERKVHGRAMTSYLGKHGTTLTEVFYYRDLTRENLRRPELCDVSCKYSYIPYIKGIGVGSRCYGFYYE